MLRITCGRQMAASGGFPRAELKQGDGRMHPTRSINLLSARADPAHHGDARCRLLVSTGASVKQPGGRVAGSAAGSGTRWAATCGMRAVPCPGDDDSPVTITYVGRCATWRYIQPFQYPLQFPAKTPYKSISWFGTTRLNYRTTLPPIAASEFPYR
jgi:hypothetical protein